MVYVQGVPLGVQSPALNDLPQLQVFVAFGLVNLKLLLTTERYLRHRTASQDAMGLSLSIDNI